MISLAASPISASTSLLFIRLHEPSDTTFWEHLLQADELGSLPDLAKILVGCEIIAAVDSVDLLAA